MERRNHWIVAMWADIENCRPHSYEPSLEYDIVPDIGQPHVNSYRRWWGAIALACGQHWWLAWQLLRWKEPSPGKNLDRCHATRSRWAWLSTSPCSNFSARCPTSPVLTLLFPRFLRKNLNRNSCRVTLCAVAQVPGEKGVTMRSVKNQTSTNCDLFLVSALLWVCAQPFPDRSQPHKLLEQISGCQS